MNYDCSKCPVTLETFCCKEAGMYDLRLPFRDGRYVYATDYAIIVRMLLDSYNGPLAESGKFPSVSGVGWNDTVVEWGPVPRPVECQKCKNRRVIPHDFYVRTTDARTNYVVVLIPCDACTIEIHKTRVAWRLVEPLMRFAPDLEVGVTSDNPGCAVHFRWNDGYALVMPLVRDEEKDV